jgi:hypothetical protein
VALAVGLVFAFAIGKLLERRRKAVAPTALRVVSTTSLGRDGSLSVVEVKDADGALRRLLVGHGGGAPRLVADLDQGADFDARLGEAEVAPRPAEAAARPARAAEGRPAPRLADPPTRHTDEGRGSRAGGPRALAPRKDLIAEVLAERTDDDDTPSPDEPQDRPSGAYTFRGLLG